MLRICLYVFVPAYCFGVSVFLLTTTPVQAGIYLAVFIASIIGIAVLARMRVLLAILFAVLGIACAYARLAITPQEIPDAFVPLYDQKVTLEGVVVALPDMREISARLTIEMQSGSEETRFIAAAPLYPTIHVGDTVRVTGTFKKPEPFETDGGRSFAYDDFLAKDGIFGVMQPANAEVIRTSPTLWLRFLRVLEGIRNTLIAFISKGLPDPESSLAVGVLVGGKQGLGKELIEAFTKAGMLQIIVLSGYNVLIVANSLMWALSRTPKRIAFGVATASIACFVLIAGAGTAALRAGLMAFFAIAARTFGKPYEVMLAVFASIGVLGFWNPLMLVYDPGFQFSFIATLGLIIGSPIIAPRLRFLKNTILIELASTTLAAEISLLPFLLWQTGHLSLVSVFANIAAMPAVPVAMATSALVAVFSLPLEYLHPVLPLVLGLMAYLPLTYIINIATLSASLPFADFILPAFPFWVVALTYLGFALLVWRQTRPPRPDTAAPQQSS